MILFERIKRWWAARRTPSREVEMVSCRDALERIQEYLDGELANASEEEIAEHFRICTRCYPHLKLEVCFRTKVHAALDGARAPEDLRARVLELLSSEAP